MNRNKLQQLAKDQDGLSTVEYIIILILIAVIGIVAWRAFGEAVVAEVNEAEGEISGLN